LKQHCGSWGTEILQGKDSNWKEDVYLFSVEADKLTDETEIAKWKKNFL